MKMRKWKQIPDEIKEIISDYQRSSPVLLGELARKLGVKVKRATLPAGVSGEIKTCQISNNTEPDYVIRVNRHESKARQRFTLAHEIAHFLLHKEHIGDGIEDDVLYRSGLSDQMEREANRLAADIIMPWHLIEEKIGQYQDRDPDDLAENIARDLKVSSTAMQIRLGIAVRG